MEKNTATKQRPDTKRIRFNDLSELEKTIIRIAVTDPKFKHNYSPLPCFFSKISEHPALPQSRTSFYRAVEKLRDAGFITIKEIGGGFLWASLDEHALVRSFVPKARMKGELA